MSTPVETLQSIPTGGDPVLEAVKWFAAVFAILLVVGAPVMAYLRKFKIDAAASAKDDAAATLYHQLQEQILRTSEDVRLLVTEKNKWFEEAAILRATVEEQKRKLADLAEGEKLIMVLRKKLDDKDEENRQLVGELMSMKDRLHVLELRLARDERDFCDGCVFGHKRTHQQEEAG
jgi:predicted RNase H-like nuclease (RuvC/YqgF family)